MWDIVVSVIGVIPEASRIADGASSHNLAPPATPTFVVLRKAENKPPTAALRQFVAPHFRRT